MNQNGVYYAFLENHKSTFNFFDFECFFFRSQSLFQFENTDSETGFLVLEGGDRDHPREESIESHTASEAAVSWCPLFVWRRLLLLFLVSAFTLFCVGSLFAGVVAVCGPEHEGGISLADCRSHERPQLPAHCALPVKVLRGVLVVLVATRDQVLKIPTFWLPFVTLHVHSHSFVLAIFNICAVLGTIL